VPEVRITPRPELLAAYGLSVADVGHFVEVAVGGEALGEAFLGSRRRADIVVRLAPAFRTSIDALRALNLPLPQGGAVPLSTIADIESKSAAFNVSRENVQRKAVIAVNLAGRDLGSAVAEIKSSLRSSLDLPPGYRFELGGQFESAERAAGLLKWSAILAILVIFFLLYMEFRNFTLASIVLLNLPLALIGGIAAVALTSGSVSIAAVIGFISLFGMATRNGLLLVSRYEDLAQTTDLASEALLLQGAADRLNPILMTALSTALALIPLALNGDASGNEIQSPMAVVILGGLLSATLLNLYVIPIIYRWVRMR
jgi:Cu/Ag efflux pump CusA